MMFKNTFFPIIIGIVLTVISCGNASKKTHGDFRQESHTLKEPNLCNVVVLKNNPIVGANDTERYLKLLDGKRIGIVANQTSVIFKATSSKRHAPELFTHLVDSLVSLHIDVKKVFAPEHGFRGMADAGELIIDGKDSKTNLPIISLYGDNKKPKPEQLKDIDVMIFDIQDVGARFYTYISSLHYVMEACAEAKIPLLILDRPNPNGHYVDGPILEKKHQSFVGMHPVPIVHGMTIGEYAQMINGEKWLKNGIQCQLTVIPVKNYTHQTHYSLPIKPSPNLPNDTAINLYPSLCFFEGTTVSVGRGTDQQFQLFGSPKLPKKLYPFQFTPKPNVGAKSPRYQGEICYGTDLGASKPLNSLNLEWLLEAYNHSTDKASFFNDYFSKLAGTDTLRQQIEAGMTAANIKETWQNGLTSFKSTRKKYLIYD